MEPALYGSGFNLLAAGAAISFTHLPSPLILPLDPLGSPLQPLRPSHLDPLSTPAFIFFALFSPL